MEDVTFALALVLGAGFLAAKLAQLIRLPSVTGYICTGMALGPHGAGLITAEMITSQLGHFTQIALMIITFGIGEHLEFKKLRHTAKSVGLIGMFEGFFTCLLVILGTFTALFFTYSPLGWTATDYAAVALLLGAVAIATAPASTMHVLREIHAAGPMTTTLLQVVAINNAMAVMMFGVVIAVAGHMVTGSEQTMLAPVFAGFLASLMEILASLLIGVLAGLLIDFIVNRLRSRSEMLTAGLSLLLLCGEAARQLHFSPLLAGMAAGCTIVNRDLRDVRLFRILNSFDPPIQILFFALAGAHIDLSSFQTAGWIGVGYFCCRAAGKYLGAGLGARLTSVSRGISSYIGLGLIPQAGIAIGLIFLIHDNPVLEKHSAVITTVVLTGVFLSELIGPVCVRYAVEKAGEAVAVPEEGDKGAEGYRDICPLPGAGNDILLVPWTWERLQPDRQPQGSVIFGASHFKTVGALTRMATILANHHRAMPVAVRILPPEPLINSFSLLEETQGLFSSAMDEALCLGYRLETVTQQAEDVATGILEAAVLTKARAILLGHPLTESAQEFLGIVERVAAGAPCPVIVIRFSGVLHTERILVPLTSLGELDMVKDIVASLSSVGRHKVTLLYLMPPDSAEREIREIQEELAGWTRATCLPSAVQCRVCTTEARLETIVSEARFHDLVIMHAMPVQGLKRFFFGSLAESVAQHCRKTIMMVHGRKKG